MHYLENIIKYLLNNIGSPISSNKKSDYLNSNKVVQKSNHQTIDNYLNMLEKGKIGDYEVDFVAENPHTIKYLSGNPNT